MRSTFAAILVKVKPGSEKKVFGWLNKHATGDASPDDCGEDCGLKKVTGDPAVPGAVATGTEILTCRRLKILEIAYLTGPYDFLVCLAVDSVEATEDFIVVCLRSGPIAELIADTQTLAGVLKYSAYQEDDAVP